MGAAGATRKMPRSKQHVGGGKSTVLDRESLSISGHKQTEWTSTGSPEIEIERSSNGQRWLGRVSRRSTTLLRDPDTLLGIHPIRDSDSGTPGLPTLRPDTIVIYFAIVNVGICRRDFNRTFIYSERRLPSETSEVASGDF
ncbi:hypothetical protein K0M31_009795 [Melipona bicolor]|uniref:Uncharacterized protein n=1 Tax=Melipona bicolor TaxID=60889 RepID=A0AA40FMQ7_9HYME|nr:hypothetical protein K0M31_009795 [Melipona bicolor]